LSATSDDAFRKVAQQVQAMIRRYKGFHWTACVHTSTTLPSHNEDNKGIVPWYAVNQGGMQFHDANKSSKEHMGTLSSPEATNKILKVGMVNFLNARQQTIIGKLKDVFDREGIKEVEFPEAVNGIMRHFGSKADGDRFIQSPVALLLLIADDELHREEDRVDPKYIRSKLRGLLHRFGEMGSAAERTPQQLWEMRFNLAREELFHEATLEDFADGIKGAQNLEQSTAPDAKHHKDSELAATFIKEYLEKKDQPAELNTLCERIQGEKAQADKVAYSGGEKNGMKVAGAIHHKCHIEDFNAFRNFGNDPIVVAEQSWRMGPYSKGLPTV
jgi:hypothetical protein